MLTGTGPLLGGRVGASFDLGSGTTLQVEVEGAYPLGEASSESEVGYELDPVPGRVSIGVFGLFE